MASESPYRSIDSILSTEATMSICNILLPFSPSCSDKIRLNFVFLVNNCSILHKIFSLSQLCVPHVGFFFCVANNYLASSLFRPIESVTVDDIFPFSDFLFGSFVGRLDWIEPHSIWYLFFFQLLRFVFVLCILPNRTTNCHQFGWKLFQRIDR